MYRSQSLRWMDQFRVAVLRRDTREVIRLIRENPNRRVRLGTSTSPLLYVLFNFQYRDRLTEKDYEFVEDVIRLYCRDFPLRLNEYHPIPMVCEWEDTTAGLYMVRLLKRCGAMVNRQFDDNSYMLWYLNKHVPYKYSRNDFNINIFKELYSKSDDVVWVCLDVVFLPFDQFKEAMEFLFSKGDIDVRNNQIIRYFVKECNKNTDYRKKLDFLLEMGFSLPKMMIPYICKHYKRWGHMIGFIKYVIKKGAVHDEKNMSIALQRIVERSLNDPYQLMRQQQTQESSQQQLKQMLREENMIQKVIKFLCENGANVDFLYRGKTAISIAVDNKSREILLILLYYAKDLTPQKLQQITSKCQIRSVANPKYSDMKDDVQALKRLKLFQDLLSKRSFSNTDLASKFSQFFTKKPRTSSG